MSLCPRCQFQNDDNSVICMQCGLNLREAGQQSPGTDPRSSQSDRNFAPNFQNPMAYPISDEEYATYITENVDYYLPAFKSLAESGKKTSKFNWSAFLISYISPFSWFFYRKMIAKGFLYYIATYIYSSISSLVTLPFLIGPIKELMQFSMQYADTPNVMPPMDQFIEVLMSFMGSILISIAIQYVLKIVPAIIAGTFGNYFYKKDVDSKIFKARMNGLVGYQYMDELKKKGKPSVFIALLPLIIIASIFVLYFAFVFILTMAMTSSAMMYY